MPHLTRLAAIALVFLSGIADAAQLIISGSGNPEYVLRQVAEAFNRSQPTHKVLIPPSNGRGDP